MDWIVQYDDINFVYIEQGWWWVYIYINYKLLSYILMTTNHILL